MAPEKCVHDCGLSLPVPSTSICFRPRCDPRSRRRSLTMPDLPVSSQVRQDSTAPAGSAPSTRADDSSSALSGGVGATQRLATALSSLVVTTPPCSPVPARKALRISVQGGLYRALDLEDGRLSSRDRDDLVEDPHGVAVQRLLREPHVRGRAVRENERWRAEDAVLAAGLLVVARERAEDVGISEVHAETVEVETRSLRHFLHDRGIVEVLPVAMTRAEKGHVNVDETTLAARSLGGRKGESSLHRLGGRGAPHSPRRVLARVDLRE